MFITSDDKVYGFGQNSFGCCGLGHNSVANEPQVIPELCHKNIKQFFIGRTFVLALNNDGQVFSWGYNSVGQLGIGVCSSEYLKPRIISYFCDKIVTLLSCGTFHSIAMTLNWMIYGWGSNVNGQIGIREKRGEEIPTPLLLEIFTNIEIKSLHCVYYKSFALTTEGSVYSWGDNFLCSLGHDLQ